MTDTTTTTTTDTTDPTDDAVAVAALVDAHLAAFSAPDDATRRALIEQAWAPTGHFADPLFAATGHDEIDALAASVPGLYPDHVFTRTSGIDLHHGQARYAFAFTGPDGTVVVDGVEVAQVGVEGRLVRVIGFFGPVPEA
ncbi:MAG TPA: hypothetical protein VGO60_05520 [Iamia sp.]|nr:hypothetical protein [Iamia sp.]